MSNQVKVTILILMMLTINGLVVDAQRFFKTELSTVQPNVVMIENFSPIALPAEVSDPDLVNRFDNKNVYTYIQRIGNDGLANYQVLYQTSFLGKLLYVALSNNLSMVFNNPSRPMNLFMNCMKKLSRESLGLEQVETIINCIIDRLNYSGN